MDEERCTAQGSRACVPGSAGPASSAAASSAASNSSRSVLRAETVLPPSSSSPMAGKGGPRSRSCDAGSASVPLSSTIVFILSLPSRGVAIAAAVAAAASLPASGGRSEGIRCSTRLGDLGAVPWMVMRDVASSRSSLSHLLGLRSLWSRRRQCAAAGSVGTARRTCHGQGF